ncbi:MAG: Ig-like domain-containing protein [Spirochaetes bacterium]|nr:Ig-like domain-containing protein [Spirochaetota bacterium]
MIQSIAITIRKKKREDGRPAMEETMKSHGTMNTTTRVAGMSRLRRFIFLLAAPVLALSMAGCNGRVFSSLPGDDLLNQLLPFLMGGGPATLVSIEVSPAVQSVPEDFQVQYYATGIYSDNTIVDMTTLVTWDVDALLLEATIDANGLLTANDAGNFTVSATFEGITGTADLEITDTVSLVHLTITAAGNKTEIADGTSIQFTATGIFSDNSTLDMTEQVAWTAGPGGYISVSDTAGTKGLATGENPSSPASTWIEAEHVASATTSNRYDIEVTSVTISSLTITPRDPVAYVIAFGTTQQFTATGTFSDASTQDLTDQVDWTSSDTDIATIDANGLSTTVSTGDTVIAAGYPKGGGPYDADDATTLSVRRISLRTITVAPTSATKNPGQTQQFTATGTYSDGTTQDLTSQVVWSSDDPTIAMISNGAGTNGLATAVSGGSVTITAERGSRSGTATFNVNAADTDLPYIDRVDLLPGNRVRVTYSEAMDFDRADDSTNYKVILQSAYVGDCSDNTNFTTTPAGISIGSVTVESQTAYVLNLSAGTDAKPYYVIASRDAASGITDIAGNRLDCAIGNYKGFIGVDTIPPYMLSIINNAPLKAIVKFSEPMMNDEGANAADNPNNYTVAEVPDDPGDDIDFDVVDVTEIDDRTFELTLEDQNATDGTATTVTEGKKYRVTTLPNVTDANGNGMGEPRFLTFTGNEQLKVVSAVALDNKTQVVITFNKDVTTASCECDDDDPAGGYDCHNLYKLFPRNNSNQALLGNITKAERGSTMNTFNQVTISHDVEQEGISYTVAAANGTTVDDGFINSASYCIKSVGTAERPTENLQAAPKDRASFLGKGDAIDSVDDGGYFIDPFADGSIFSWSFTYRDRVYLGTNDFNNAAFRFDPDGMNSVLVTFASEDDPAKDGFGYDATHTGFNGEQGVVGFTANSLTVDVDGTPTDFEVLTVGDYDPSGVDVGYFTQDADTELDWVSFDFAANGGANTQSIQTIFGFGTYLLSAATSNQNTQAPAASLARIQSDVNGVLSVASVYNMSGFKDIDHIGKNGTNYLGFSYKDTGEAVIGLDSVIEFEGKIYFANSCGVVYADEAELQLDTPALGVAQFSSYTQATPDTWDPDVTLMLPDAPAGLGKVTPGQKGVPKLLEYNGKLYMARNVAAGDSGAKPWTLNKTPHHSELWVCDPTDGGTDVTNPTICESDEWTRLIAGTEDELKDEGGTGVVTAKQISLLQNLGDGWLYVGFDDYTDDYAGGTTDQNGIRLFKINSANPSATDGSTLSSAGWTPVGNVGFWHNPTIAGGGSYDNETYFDTFFSSTWITDGVFSYIYFTVGDSNGDTGDDAIQVYRERIEN